MEHSNSKKNLATKSKAISSPTSSSKSNKTSASRIKVAIRIRPPIKEDFQYYVREDDFEVCPRPFPDGKGVTLSRLYYDDRHFAVDRVLGMDANQEQMYDEVAYDIVADVLKGYNGTIMAYGQTGSGKTYTTFGSSRGGASLINEHGKFSANPGVYFPSIREVQPKDFGVIPRSVFHIFNHVNEHKDHIEFQITVSFLQIYQEVVLDLLSNDMSNMNVREDPKTGGFFVDQLTHVVVENPMQLLELISVGALNRAASATSMNKDSSRSHVLLFITVEQKPRKGHETPDNMKPKSSILTIVDLAGSERLSKTGSEGQRLEEAKHINKSLSALGNCVAALAAGKSRAFIPYRESKLTRLLADCLGGNAKACLCATLSPASINYDETYSTLLFATRAMTVTNNVMINEIDDPNKPLLTKIAELEQENKSLKQKTAEHEREIHRLSRTIEELKSREPKTAKDREQELTFRFTNIINLLQAEVLRLRSLLEQQQQQLVRTPSQGNVATTVGSVNTGPLDQLVKGLLSIPDLKEKLWQKLEQELIHTPNGQ